MTNLLLRSILRDAVSLTPAQLTAVNRVARLHAAEDSWGWLLPMLPGLSPLLAIPVWQRLRPAIPFGLYVACEVVFAILVVLMVVFLLRRQFARHAWRAVRELGFADVCGRCGYNLQHRSENRSACPECGEPISPLGPNKLNDNVRGS